MHTYLARSLSLVASRPWEAVHNTAGGSIQPWRQPTWPKSTCLRVCRSALPLLDPCIGCPISSWRGPTVLAGGSFCECSQEEVHCNTTTHCAANNGSMLASAVHSSPGWKGGVHACLSSCCHRSANHNAPFQTNHGCSMRKPSYCGRYAARIESWHSSWFLQGCDCIRSILGRRTAVAWYVSQELWCSWSRTRFAVLSVVYWTSRCAHGVCRANA